MDIQIRKYIQYEIRELSKRKKEQKKLEQRLKELRQEILDESPLPPDGQPRGKGASSNPVENKVIRLEKVEKRFEVLNRELENFDKLENKIMLMGRIPRVIYKETIVGTSNPEYVAISLGICRASLFNIKASILKYIGEELGLFLEEE